MVFITERLPIQKPGAYSLVYTLKKATGEPIQPKDHKGTDTTIATEIQF